MEVLNVFRQKTAPAFEVALRLGAFCAGAKKDVHRVLSRYSEALGIAYQIRDDLEDFAGRGDSHDLRGLRPSVVLALAHQRASDGAEAELTTSLWRRACNYDEVADAMERLIARRGVVESVRDLLEVHAARATRSLHPLKNSILKGLLRRVITRVFGDVQVRRYCRESEAQHVTGRSVGTEPAG
jgi:geranylgeranyl pyrophosphate synthase